MWDSVVVTEVGTRDLVVVPVGTTSFSVFTSQTVVVVTVIVSVRVIGTVKVLVPEVTVEWVTAIRVLDTCP